MALNSNSTFVINPPKPDHNQEPPTEKIQETQFRETILDEVTSNPTRKLKDIYDEKLQGSSLEFIPIYGQVRTTMSKLRSKILPPVPSTIQELKIEGEWEKHFEANLSCCTSTGSPKLSFFARIMPYQP